MSDVQCNHTKVQNQPCDEAKNNIIMINQRCLDCGSFRMRKIFNIQFPGLTVCSEDTGSWVSPPSPGGATG